MAVTFADMVAVAHILPAASLAIRANYVFSGSAAEIAHIDMIINSLGIGCIIPVRPGIYT